MATQITNSAEATYTTTGTPSPVTISSNELSITYENSSGITITKTASPTTFTAGSIIDYTVRITNTGSLYFTGVRIIDNLGGGNLAYVVGSGRLTTSSQTYSVSPVATNPLTFTLQQLAVGSTMTLTYKAQVIFNLPSSVDTIINTAQAIGYTSTGTENAFANSTISRNSTSDVSITKSSTLDTVVPNQNFTYNITLTNGTSDDATVSSIKDTLPSAFTITSVKLKIGSGSQTTLSSSEYSLSSSNEFETPTSSGPTITIPANGSTVLSISGYLS